MSLYNSKWHSELFNKSVVHTEPWANGIITPLSTRHLIKFRGLDFGLRTMNIWIYIKFPAFEFGVSKEHSFSHLLFFFLDVTSGAIPISYSPHVDTSITSHQSHVWSDSACLLAGQRQTLPFADTRILFLPAREAVNWRKEKHACIRKKPLGISDNQLPWFVHSALLRG